MAIDQQGLYQTVTDMYTMVDRELGGRYQPFLNYGYDLRSGLAMEQQDAAFDIYAQLYHYVLRTVDVHGADVLEIGSGRGGGSYYIKQYLGAKKVVGIEYLPQNVSASRDSFGSVNNLEFYQGDASNLDIEVSSVDVVANIESSHCYPNLERFFEEVYRVLCNGGSFCYADLMTPDMNEQVKQITAMLPFELTKVEDITDGVVGGLTLANKRKLSLIHELDISEERKAWWINEWACVGTPIWQDLQKRDLMYMHYVFKKM